MEAALRAYKQVKMKRVSPPSLTPMQVLEAREPAEVPKPTYDITVYGSALPVSDVSEAVESWSHLQGITRVDFGAINMGVPTYISEGEPRYPTATITTPLSPDDSWGVYCLLSQLPSHLVRYTAAARGEVAVDVVYPADGSVGLVFTREVPQAIITRVKQDMTKLLSDRRVLLFDSDLTTRNADGVAYPRSWLLDILPTAISRMNSEVSGDTTETYKQDAPLFYSGGRLWLTEESDKPAHDIKLHTTDLLNQLQLLYDEGWVYSKQSLGDSYVVVGEQLYKPYRPLYYNPVAYYYS